MTSLRGTLSSQGATIIAALIGALLGSLGTVLLQGFLEIREREFATRELLVQRHIYQLQEGAESLYWRVRNANKLGGAAYMPEVYYTTSTIYALGRVLAAQYLLAADGAYPTLQQHCAPLGSLLDERELGILLADRKLPRYVRLALAESVLETKDSPPRMMRFLSFRSTFDEKTWDADPFLAPITLFVREMGNVNNEKLLETLAELVRAASKCTRVSASLGSE